MLALIGNFDALAGRLQMRQRQPPALDRFHVRRFHLREIVHEDELGEVVIDAGALQMLAGAEKMFLRQRLAADRLVDRRARGPGPHQSSHVAIPAVTSSKSVSATPFDTKRGAQWAIAERTRASSGFSCTRAPALNRGPRRADTTARAGPWPWRAANSNRTPVTASMATATNASLWRKAARVEQDIEADAGKRGEEFGHHRADQRAAGGEPQAREQIGHRSRQDHVEQARPARAAERAGDFDIFRRHRARAVGYVHDDSEDRGEHHGRQPRVAGIAEPERRAAAGSPPSAWRTGR